jgi:hypothetical protein
LKNEAKKNDETGEIVGWDALMEMIKKTQAMEDKPVRLKDTMVIYTLCEL